MMKRSAIQPGTKPLQRRTPLRAGKAPTNRAGMVTLRERNPDTPLRKPTLKPKKVPPNADERCWMAAVARLGCIVCLLQQRGYVPCAVHHIVEGGRRLGHMYTIGLCDPGHHQNSPDQEQISRHPNRARFVVAYGSEYELLELTRQLVKAREPATQAPGAKR